ncbi:hypothetical protein [Burkholderia sp. MSMB617WGS]|uniref:hypothetical protein n=1 Tax=Burkholderia sp. MSMB617WGS TaxID=1637831 RepID=UPI000A75F7B9|nr:hypothetical protein [Burkholderia sp. MSMB617WGS]
MNKITPAPLTQHDLDHHRLRIQVLALQQIVLRLLVQRSFEEVDGDPKETRELAPVRLREALQGLEPEPGTSEWHPAEAAAFDDEHREVLADLHKHLEAVLADLLPTEED